MSYAFLNSFSLYQPMNRKDTRAFIFKLKTQLPNTVVPK